MSNIETLQDIRRGCLDGWAKIRTDPTTWAPTIDRTLATLVTMERTLEKLEARIHETSHSLPWRNDIEQTLSRVESFTIETNIIRELLGVLTAMRK